LRLGLGKMKNFYFKGELSASKSVLNRLLVIQSYFPKLLILGDSKCDDVELMKSGLSQLAAGQPMDCGHAGTVLRFLSLRASREPGKHVLRGSERLFSRPQNELLPIFGQLSVDAEIKKNELVLNSRGWRLVVDGLQVNAQRSSQFASSVVLNSWNLKFPLHFQVTTKIVSESYFKMTLEMVRALGMKIDGQGNEFFIPSGQVVTTNEYRAEMDMSSAFVVAALAIVAGEAELHNFPLKSLQPDVIFVSLLQKMGALALLEKNVLKVKMTRELRGIEANLENSPDLFPVLGVLCALAKTPSEIKGLGHLKYKESSRLLKTKELLELMGARVEASEDLVRIFPAQGSSPMKDILFHADQDHRMAMACQVARWAGYSINCEDMNVVTKSFPEFIKIAERDLGVEL
jgi:3-phosphoshikimate 1-carboxyvinyltransferase